MPVKNVFETEVDYLPGIVAIVQTSASSPEIALDYNLEAPLPDDVADTVTEVNPQDLFLTGKGQITGVLDAIPSTRQNAEIIIVPTLRNWNEAGSIQAELVNNLLVNSGDREQHINAIVDLVRQNGYDGIDLDYRAISPDLREAYTNYLAELREALPEDKQLSVRVELPQQLSTGTWDTGAYDWQGIGHAADTVKLPVWPDPKAYAADGQMENMLNWAVTQINRQKIQLIFRANSTSCSLKSFIGGIFSSFK